MSDSNEKIYSLLQQRCADSCGAEPPPELFAKTQDLNLQFLTSKDVKHYCLLDILFPFNEKVKQTFCRQECVEFARSRIRELLLEFWCPSRECQLEDKWTNLLPSGLIVEFIEKLSTFLQHRRKERSPDETLETDFVAVLDHFLNESGDELSTCAIDPWPTETDDSLTVTGSSKSPDPSVMELSEFPVPELATKLELMQLEKRVSTLETDMKSIIPDDVLIHPESGSKRARGGDGAPISNITTTTALDEDIILSILRSNAPKSFTAPEIRAEYAKRLGLDKESVSSNVKCFNQVLYKLQKSETIIIEKSSSDSKPRWAAKM